MNYQIENSPLGGLGMMAARPIERGELIHTETALVFCDTGYLQSRWLLPGTANTFFAAQRTAPISVLHSAVAQLEAAQQGVFRALGPQPGYDNTRDRIVRRFEHNAYDFNRVNNPRRIHVVVYETFSRINHSCVPNAALEIWPRRTQFPEGQARLIATRAIPAGDEIFVNYMPNHWMDHHQTRVAALNNHWGFRCTCVGCTSPFIPMDTSARNLAVSCHAAIGAMAAAVTEEQKTSSIMHIETYIKTLVSLGIWDDKLSFACLELARLHFGKQDYLKAAASAFAGSMVEENFYSPDLTPQLSALFLRCHQLDDRSRDEYNKSAIGPYPLT